MKGLWLIEKDNQNVRKIKIFKEINDLEQN